MEVRLGCAGHPFGDAGLIGLAEAFSESWFEDEPSPPPRIRYWDHGIGAWVQAPPGETAASIAVRHTNYLIEQQVSQEPFPLGYFVYMG